MTYGNFSNNDLGNKATTTALNNKVTYNGNSVDITLTLVGDVLTISTTTPS